jgi:hypothetical protein
MFVGRSLLGHVVFAQLLWSAPFFFLVALPIIRQDGVPSFSRVLNAALAVVLAGAAWGVAMWFTVSRPLIARREQKK